MPCACGRPCAGAEHEWIHDAKGSALYVRGVCLSCGRQEALYLSEPVATTATAHHARLATWLHDDVEAMVRQAAGLIEQELSRTERVAA